jgi:hypothetical protein
VRTSERSPIYSLYSRRERSNHCCLVMTLLALAIISLLAAASTADSAAMAQRADHEWSERYENGREKRQIGEGGKL